MELINGDLYVVRNVFLFPSNTYLLTNSVNKHCLIIDPGIDVNRIEEKIVEYDLTPKAILATHGHFDHIASAAFFQKKYSIPYYLHKKDAKLGRSINFYLKIARLDHSVETPVPDVLFEEEYEQLSIDGFNLEIYNLPGHSPGSCILKSGNYLFSGDLMYANGMGLPSMPREDKPMLRKSIIKAFTIFDDDALLLPGHGISAILGEIKSDNLELQNFIQTGTDAEQ